VRVRVRVRVTLRLRGAWRAPGRGRGRGGDEGSGKERRTAGTPLRECTKGKDRAWAAEGKQPGAASKRKREGETTSV
jgi:hypothetical protein